MKKYRAKNYQKISKFSLLRSLVFKIKPTSNTVPGLITRDYKLSEIVISSFVSIHLRYLFRVIEGGFN